VRADEAAIENAKLQLAYTNIYSPLDGITGQLLIQGGNLIKANDSNPLVVIDQISPIYVEFAVPEQYLPAIRNHMASSPLAVQVAPEGEDTKPVGSLTFVDNSVDTATGTIKLKATFANPHRTLWPGQFVRVKLLLAEQENAIVLPSQAVQLGPQGPYVFVVNPDLTVALRPVTVDRTVDSETVISKGVSVGEQIITDGQSRLTSGAKVKPQQELTKGSL
jgi:multidrug efflux system membrane fusion protein